MEALRNTAGFFGPNMLADITLVVQIVFYLVLCAGVVAQLQEKYKWHDRLQIPIVVLNIFFIIFVMIPTMRAIATSGGAQVPKLVTSAHAVLGTIAQLLAIYCLLAGLKILPRKIGVLRYWMWAAFTAWTATIIFGIGVYMVFYTPILPDPSQETVENQPTEEVIVEHNEEAATPEPVATAEPVVEEASPTTEADATEDELISEHEAEPKKARFLKENGLF